MKEMDEFLQAIRIANGILDRPMADPDDDQAILARQFLRTVEIGGMVARHAFITIRDCVFDNDIATRARAHFIKMATGLDPEGAAKGLYGEPER